MKKAFEKLEMSFAYSPLDDGTPRWLGTHADRATAVDIVGRDGGVERASVTMAVVEGLPPESAIRNATAISVLMTNTGWQPGYEWVLASLNESAKTRHGAVAYETTVIMDGLVTLAARPAVDGR